MYWVAKGLPDMWEAQFNTKKKYHENKAKG